VSLIRNLPSNQQNERGLRENLYSPQFFEALDSFDEVLYSENCETILRSLGIWDQEIFDNSQDRNSN
jgi:hypothetical protein